MPRSITCSASTRPRPCWTAPAAPWPPPTARSRSRSCSDAPAILTSRAERCASLAHLLEVVHALLVRQGHVGQAVAVHVGHFELRPHAAVVVELVGNPRGLPLLA